MSAEKERYSNVYQSKADLYDALVRHEDHDGALLPALRAIVPLEGLDCVELGAGTGRLTRLLAPHVKTLRAFDSAPAMLEVATRHLEGAPHVSFAVADHAETGLPDATADLVVEGWAFGHATHYFPGDWRSVVARYVDEATRLLRPSGTLVILETLGTGKTEPAPPNAELAAMYAWLVSVGFTQKSIRTDYVFPSLDEAKHITKSFFGRDFDFMVTEAGARLPECTGLWWREATR